MNDIMIRMMNFFYFLFLYHCHHYIIHIISLLLTLKNLNFTLALLPI
jgi:hypothetical protein